MGSAGLSPLQVRVLETLAAVSPRWTLVGGAALAGFHLHHRTTRDLDLFWRGRERLERLAEDCADRLRQTGLTAVFLQSSPTFARLRVESADGPEVVVVDLVADATASSEPGQEQPVGGAVIEVASPHQILVDKLCVLLGRAELRDLVDVRALLAAGGDLRRALAEAPRRDAGFSPLTLAWLLRALPIARLAQAGNVEEDAAALECFRDDLVKRLVRESLPEA